MNDRRLPRGIVQAAINVAPRFARASVAVAAIAAVVLGSSGARVAAADLQTVRVGKAIATSFPFTTLEVGQQAKIWESVGLKLEISSFKGDAQMQQGFTANAVDIGLGSGPAMGYHAKGVPAVAVASLGGPPLDMALIVSNSSNIKNVASLRGKRIGVTTAGSLTDWLVHELARRQGWGSDGIITVPMGSTEARIAAMDSGDIAGTAQDTTVGYALEQQHKAKVLMTFGGMVKTFHTHVIFARDEMIAKNPELVSRFLKGWFKTVAYMRTHKEQTVKTAAETMQDSKDIVARSYDTDMPMMSSNGVFDPAAVAVVRSSLTELGLSETPPDIKSMYTNKFVPVKY